MKASPLAWIIVGALIAGLIVAWCGRRQDAALAVARVRADSLQRVSDSLDAVHARDSLAAAAAVRALGDSLRQTDRRLDRSTAHADSLTRAIGTTAAATVPKAQVLAALAAKDTVIADQATKIHQLEADTTAWRDRWLGARNETNAWRNVAVNAQQQLAAANKRGARRWGCTGGLSALAGAGFTAGAGGVVVGPTVSGGLGITCGRHL